MAVWLAVRAVYLFGVKDDGTNIFEERVVAVNGDTREVAMDRGVEASKLYARDHDFDVHPEWSGYGLDSEDSIGGEWVDVRWTDGAEVWSEMFESGLSLYEFYARRYTDYDYHPD